MNVGYWTGEADGLFWHHPTGCTVDIWYSVRSKKWHVYHIGSSFYTKLASGASLSDALRLARTWMKDNQFAEEAECAALAL